MSDYQEWEAVKLASETTCTVCGLQGYLAHKKQPPPLGPPQDPRYGPTVGSQGGPVSHVRGTPVARTLYMYSR